MASEMDKIALIVIEVLGTKTCSLQWIMVGEINTEVFIPISIIVISELRDVHNSFAGEQESGYTNLKLLKCLY